MTDQELIERHLSGDPDALDQLVRRHQRNVFSFLVHLTGNRTEAEDLFQETFIKAIAALPGYREQGAFGSWLIRVAHTVTLDAWKRNKGRETSDDRRLMDYPDQGPATDARTESREIEQAVTGAVAKLPEKQRRVFLLRQHSDLKFREIAEQTKEPLNTVLSHMRYAVATLRAELQPFRSDDIDRIAERNRR